MNAQPLHVAQPLALEEDQPTPVERSYLEVLYYLASRHEPVIAARLVRWMHVRPPTVTHVVQRLEGKRLIARNAAGEISLTSVGNMWAEQIVRRHRMVECFLYNIMGIPWHQVHREAVRLEPALSPALEAQIEHLVGDATICPHGNPIPGQADQALDDMPLTSAPTGVWFVITRIDEEAGEDPCTLQMLWTRGILPGTALIRLLDPVGGIAIRRADRRIVLSQRVAGLIWGKCSPPDAA